MSLRTPASSRVRSMLARRRVALATMLVALGLLLASASYAEARGAPRWLSRWLRAVSGRSASLAPVAAPGDTVVLFGPKTMALGTATSATFVERFTVPGAPTSTMATASSGYLLRTTNGPGGAGAISGGTITLNGAVVVTAAQLAALSAGASLDVPVQLAPADTIVAALTGPANTALSVSVLAAPDPTFLVFGPKQYERVNGAPITITERFTVPAGGIAPSYLCVRNGELDGTRRNSSATISLNGTEVVTPSDLNQQVAGFRKRVTYLPAGQENVLLVQLRGAPGSRLTLCAAATDAAPPKITVTAPVRGLITRQLEVDAVGVVDDQTAVTITVNGLPATVAAGTPGKTSFTAKTPLAVEGANTIVIRAVDAAGNATDSTRTVIRDTQAPVVTLDALPDSVLYRRDSVLTVTGTITDRTAVTANVNGTPLVVDSATKAFSQVVTLSQGTNFIAITATDAAGNATSVVRQITLDNVPPTLTLTAPAAGSITKVATTKVIGTAVAQSAVTVTVNGTAAPVGTNGAFSADVTLTEGSNTLTVVATNAAGVTATATRVVTLDTQAPVLAWTSPLDSAITQGSSAQVGGTVTDQSAVTLTLNGAAVALTAVNATTNSYLTTEPLVADGVVALTLVATDAAGNVVTRSRGITRDATPPVITVLEPDAGLVTNAATVRVVGSVADLTKTALTVNGTTLTLAADGGFAGDVPLTAGANTLAFVALDAAGNRTQVDRALVRDVDPPVVTVSSPSDNVLVKTATVTVRGTITDASTVTATLNGTPLTIAADRSYQTTIALSEGPNTLTLVATDAAGNATTTTRSITLDTTAPVLTVTSPADGITTDQDNTAVAGTATDQSPVKVTVNGASTTLSSAGAFTSNVALVTGANAIQIVATDSAGNTASATRTVTRAAAVDPNLPPNPKTVAPALNRTVATTQAAATSFLYTGANPIQTGVLATTIIAERASTFRGRVINPNGTPLPGATIAIKGRPEFGATKSRADGWYDLVVNGGGTLTVTYDKTGYFGAQRTALAPRQDYGRIDDVVLLKPDPVVSVVQLTGGATPQVARSSVMTDTDGTRTATVIFDAGTTATLKKPDGTTQPITTLSVRLTEYTVGDRGREAMPAPLPPTSAYTYAVEPTADEALAVGGTITFSRPVSAYVENFLGFPVGLQVPLGALDRASTTWVPQPDGRVIKVLSVTGGTATIDANGDGAADPQSVLDSLGLSVTELQQLAATFTPGATVMRTRLFGLYPFDANLPFKARGVDPIVVAPPGCASATRDIIKCDVRVATEAVDVSGTPYTLSYTSARAAGAADRTLRIPVTGATMPADLMGMYVRVWVAGQMTEQQYLPTANVTYEYAWDGNDAYGRPVQGNPTAVVEIGHLFPVEYQIPAATAASFGLPCAGTAVNGIASCVLPKPPGYDTERHSFWRTSQAITKLGGVDAKAQGLGGFDFNVHHQYDPVGRVLYLGDGTTRIADAISPVVTTVLGNGCANYAFDNIKATDSCLFYPHGAGLAAMPDGSFLVGNTGSLRRVRPDGIVVRFAGNYPPCPPCYPPVALTGEGGPATNAYVTGATLPAVAPDGSVYFYDGPWFRRILRVTPDGILTRVLGDESGTAVVDGKSVRSTKLSDLLALTVGPDGAIYFSQSSDPTRVYRIGPDSVLRTFAGAGVWGSAGDEQPARHAQFTRISALAFGPDGSLYIGQDDDFSVGNRRVRRVTPDGIIHRVIGGGVYGGPGVPAIQRALFAVQSLMVSAEGTVSIGAGNTVVQVTADGIFHHVAGDPATTNFGGDKGPSLKAGLSFVSGLAQLPDGSMLIYDSDHHRVRQMAAPMPGFGGGAFTVASEDGSELYSFDASGRHLSTFDLRSGRKIFGFSYDSQGRIRSLADAGGFSTQIERNSAGDPIALIAASGKRIELTVDASGNLSKVAIAGGEATTLSYSTGGLLATRTDGADNPITAATYDASGHLLTSTNAFQGVSGIVPLEGVLTSEARMTAPTSSSQQVFFQRLASGTREIKRTVDPGMTEIKTISTDGTEVLVATDGSRTTTQVVADPRYGLQAPTTQLIIRLPSGLTLAARERRGVEGEDPNDIFNIFAQIDTTEINGRVSTTKFDRSENSGTMRSAAGLITTLDFDGANRPTVLKLPGRAALERMYDAAGLLASVSFGGRTAQVDYDSQGRAIAETNALGIIERYAYDNAGRVARKTLRNGQSVAYGYDQAGNLSTVTPPGRPAHGVTLNSGGKLTTYTPPTVDAGERATSLRYDSAGRLTAVLRPDGTENRTSYVTSSLDYAAIGADGDTVRLIHSPLTGNLMSSTRSNGVSLTYAYDGSLRTSVAWNGAVQGSAAYSYDADFRPSSERINGGTALSFTYDADGELTRSGSLTLQRAATSGDVTATSLGGIRTSIWTSAFGETDSVGVTFNNTPRYSARFLVDALGRITERTERIGSTSVISLFAYDSLGQLTDVSKNGQPVEHYEYDANGNRTSVLTQLGTLTGQTDVQDRLLNHGSEQFRYTKNGELRQRIRSSDTTTYSYDAWGHLRAAILPTGKSIEYLLDAQSRRVGKKIDGVLRQAWLYRDDHTIIAELDSVGRLKSRFVYGESGDSPEYMIRGPSTYKLVLDERGSVRMAIDSATGVVEQTIEYDTFGRVTQNSNPGFQPFGFGGGLYDEHTGLVHFGAREYDPTLGRWTSKDPLLFDAGDENLYRYVGNDPVNRLDRSGFAADASLVAQEEAMQLNALLEKQETEVRNQKIKRLKQSLCHFGATSLELYGRMDAVGDLFENHHVLQNAKMRGVKGYTRYSGKALPLMGGSKVPGSPHWLANEFQRKNRNSGMTALQTARGSLYAAGCARKDVDKIMKEIQNYADRQGWPLP